MIRIPVLLTVMLSMACLVSCHSPETGSHEPQSDCLEKAMQQEFRMTQDPALGYIPRERLAAAKDYTENFSLPGGGPLNRLTALGWTERGPNNVGGRTRTIMIDKRDPSGNTVFAGSVSGGIFKTTNFANASPTWTVVNDLFPNLAISVLLQDPYHPDTMYAATGEGWFNIDAVRGAGILKSTNGGSSWSLMPSTTGFEYVQDMVIDSNSNFYVTLRNNTTTESRGVMRSTDRGATWVRVLGLPLPGFGTGRAADLETASNGDVYASLGILGRSEVYKSSFALHGTNTGAAGTWTNITPSTPTVTQRTKIMVAPSDPLRVYLLMQDSASSQVQNIYRSSNGGTTWTSLTAPGALNNGANSQTWFNLAGAVDPNDPNTLVVGGLNLAKSTDGGNNWTQITTSASVHVDHHALVFDGSSKLVNGNDGGIYHSVNINTASPVFTVKNAGYNVTQFYACDIHPSVTDYFLAGAQDNGTQKFTAAGMNSTTVATGGDGGFCHIDQNNGQLQITSNTGNNYRFSTNGGTSFAAASAASNDRGQFINPTDFDDVNDVLYCGDDAGKYYFVNNWSGTPAGTQVNLGVIGTREVTAVKVDPFSANTIWIGASYNLSPAVVKISGANTVTPTVLAVATLSGPLNSAVSSIDVDPSNPNHIIATVSNYGSPSVFESTDGGTLFLNIEGNLPDMPVRWGMFAPANAELNGAGGGLGGIILGTELGVWTTSLPNGGSTVWIPNNNGLANVRVDMLKYRASDKTLVAATHGRGLFTTVLPTTVTGIGGPPDNTRNFIRYIHAESNWLQIVTGGLQTRTMTIQVFDMKGRKLYETAGAYRNTSIDLSGLPRGVYHLRCLGNAREIYNRRFIK